ncbi:septum formation initiator [Streptomyces bambusae]|uniref:septum formation initiator n=1 Tax=Streptomyces bambusae TaxID=1550616 RepID=UPI001CFFB9C8|nr:septum formation initiator [Streptomyces bambusae]MCB5170067.1 septum formation initiator [Streptomyces bambusae]
MFPYILLILVLLWQCVIIGYTFNLAANAADEAARAGAVGDSCEAAAREHIGSAWEVTVNCGGDPLTEATVSLRMPLVAPQLLNIDVPIRAKAAAVNERTED